jgi:hypothetical protein
MNKVFDSLEKKLLLTIWIIFKNRGNTFEDFISQMKLLIELNEGKKNAK